MSTSTNPRERSRQIESARTEMLEIANYARAIAEVMDDEKTAHIYKDNVIGELLARVYAVRVYLTRQEHRRIAIERAHKEVRP